MPKIKTILADDDLLLRILPSGGLSTNRLLWGFAINNMNITTEPTIAFWNGHMDRHGWSSCVWGDICTPPRYEPCNRTLFFIGLLLNVLCLSVVVDVCMCALWGSIVNELPDPSGGVF